MTNRILIQRSKSQRVQPSGTPAASGVFNTSACPDTRAARIRNTVSPAGSLCHNWDTDRANSPSEYPEISDRPE